MTLYIYRCPNHGEIEVNKPMAEAGAAEWCPRCTYGWTGDELVDVGFAPMTRVYTPPVTDCHSFGKNQYGARTPEHLRRPRSEDQALAFRDAARAEGTRRQWGPGRTTGT